MHKKSSVTRKAQVWIGEFARELMGYSIKALVIFAVMGAVVYLIRHVVYMAFGIVE